MIGGLPSEMVVWPSKFKSALRLVDFGLKSGEWQSDISQIWDWYKWKFSTLPGKPQLPIEKGLLSPSSQFHTVTLSHFIFGATCLATTPKNTLKRPIKCHKYLLLNCYPFPVTKTPGTLENAQNKGHQVFQVIFKISIRWRVVRSCPI